MSIMSVSERFTCQLIWLMLISMATTRVAAEDSLIGINNAEVSPEVIIVDGFVDTNTCYQHLVDADASGNNDGKLQADEFVTFAQSQAPNGELDRIESYQAMPLVLQATFVTLTCLCRDERFGGDPRDVNCCLGVDAHIAIVGNDASSTSEEATRLFATCFLTDQAIQEVLGSEPPSAAPTSEPAITEPPTSPPTSPPTVPPTNSPTESPTTKATTEAPFSIPTATPSATSNPTFDHSSVEPTSPAVATPLPTKIPTLSPTLMTPVSAPPTALLATPTRTSYTIAIKNGGVEEIASSVYEPDLVNAMNELATVVVDQIFTTSKRRRQLQVVLKLPTTISNYQATNCTESLVAPSDRCENVEHKITLVDSQALDHEQVSEFETALLEAILRGELQDSLPDTSIVKILTGMVIPIIPPVISEDAAPPEDQGLSGGATASIVIAVLAVALMPICAYLAMRSKQEEKEPYGTYEPHDVSSAHELVDERDVEATPPASAGPGTLGARPNDYGKNYGKDPSGSSSGHIQQVQKVPPLTPERQQPDANSFDDQDSSSNAGSSGWSSSAGLSSYNTGSAEDSMDLLNSPQASSLAAIGAASAVARRMENRRNITSPMSSGIEELEVPVGAVSRSDLDNAIEAGDWAAVGATAALLAAASDSQSASSKSKTSRASRSQTTSVSSVDAARAAELDHLVDAGDWEGVVLAAAKFEAQEDSVRSGNEFSARSSSAGSETRSGTGSGFSPSVSTSVSESASKAKKRDEIRREVEALVRRVVPEELDNVDEMMQQFKGREEELVETLRTMQERAVAQKARTAGHKAAKQEARRTVQRGGLPPVAPPLTPDETPTRQEAPSSRDGQSSTVAASDATDGSLRHRTALEEAIEAGDWEAVGTAAALMSDTSMASGSTADWQASRGPRAGGVTADRARELDEMIDRGDWAAVVEAAGRYNQADKKSSRQAPGDFSAMKRPSRSTGSAAVDSTMKRSKQLQEEEDALAQAEIWMQIAQQSKVEGSTDVGASDAADWAIARSLKSLKKAEQGDNASADGSHQGGSHKSEDDESV